MDLQQQRRTRGADRAQPGPPANTVRPSVAEPEAGSEAEAEEAVESLPRSAAAAEGVALAPVDSNGVDASEAETADPTGELHDAARVVADAAEAANPAPVKPMRSKAKAIGKVGPCYPICWRCRVPIWEAGTVFRIAHAGVAVCFSACGLCVTAWLASCPFDCT